MLTARNTPDFRRMIRWSVEKVKFTETGWFRSPKAEPRLTNAMEEKG
jgi:hypothetical protein